jgi:hypothetical protein
LQILTDARPWRTAADLVAMNPASEGTEPSPAPGVPGGSASKALASLLPKGVRIVSRGVDDGEFGYVVVDDGKGASLVQINVQPDMSNVRNDLFKPGHYTTLADGTEVTWRKQPGEKGIPGIVWWTVDTMRPDGSRVVVSAFNSGTEHTSATRATPALTMAQLQAIALSKKWFSAATGAAAPKTRQRASSK